MNVCFVTLIVAVYLFVYAMYVDAFVASIREYYAKRD